MERSKIDIAGEHCRVIRYNYTNWPPTFGQCKNRCGNSGRGSGRCDDCAEKDLTELVGEKITEGHHLWGDIYDLTR